MSYLHQFVHETRQLLAIVTRLPGMCVESFEDPVSGPDRSMCVAEHRNRIGRCLRRGPNPC